MNLKEKRRLEREELLEQRKGDMIDSGFQCFCRNGIEPTTMIEIAKHAEVGVASIYRYFKTKEELVIQCAIRFWETIEKSYVGLKMENEFANGTGIEQIECILNLIVQTFKEKGNQLKFLHDFDIFVVTKNISKERLEQYEKCVDCLKPVLMNSIEKGIKDNTVIEDYDAEIMYYTLTHTLMAILQKLSVSNDILKSDSNIDGPVQLEILVNLLLKSLKK